METSKILKKARILIHKGWTKGVSQRGNNFCAYGACSYAAWDKQKQRYDALKLLNFVVSDDEVLSRNVVTFNDHPDTTFEDIALVFDFAIGIAEAEEELAG